MVESVAARAFAVGNTQAALCFYVEAVRDQTHDLVFDHGTGGCHERVRRGVGLVGTKKAAVSSTERKP